jgi:hypothetical protein
MKTLLIAGILFSALLLSACDWSSVGFNAKCKEYCATGDVTDNESPAAIDAAMKRKCEAMERHGNPQVLDRNKTEVGFTCPA